MDEAVSVVCANKHNHFAYQRLLPICSPHSHLISQYVFLKFPPKRIIFAIPRTLRHRPEGIQPEDRKGHHDRSTHRQAPTLRLFQCNTRYSSRTSSCLRPVSEWRLEDPAHESAQANCRNSFSLFYRWRPWGRHWSGMSN